MAGTLPGIANSQRIDGQGKPLVGGLLYIYLAGTLTPATAFKDFNLTAGQEYPFPIVLDAFGQVPPFYLADGFYRARLTDASGGTKLFDEAQLPAVGNNTSGGGGGGGTTVDPTTIFGTGDFDWQPRAGARVGWVRANGRTIGSASSGASERANADCQPLFEFNWNTYDDTRCPVIGGRGVSAIADWNADKQLTLLDGRFIIPIGLDDMGNTAAGRATGVPVVSGSSTAAASVLGEVATILTQAQLPAIKPPITINDPQHDHSFTGPNIPSIGANGGDIPVVASTTTRQTEKASTGITAAFTNNLGSGTAHNNTPLVMTGTLYQKL